VSDWLHAPAILPLGEELLVPVGWEAGACSFFNITLHGRMIGRKGFIE